MTAAEKYAAWLMAEFQRAGFEVKHLDGNLGFLLSRSGETWHARDIARLQWLALSLGVSQ